jgi:hypothetical protein
MRYRTNQNDDRERHKLLEQILLSPETTMNPRSHLSVVWRPNELLDLSLEVGDVHADDIRQPHRAG